MSKRRILARFLPRSFFAGPPLPLVLRLHLAPNQALHSRGQAPAAFWTHARHVPSQIVPAATATRFLRHRCLGVVPPSAMGALAPKAQHTPISRKPRGNRADHDGQHVDNDTEHVPRATGDPTPARRAAVRAHKIEVDVHPIRRPVPRRTQRTGQCPNRFLPDRVDASSPRA